jgi:hypothetical protein
MKSESEAKKKQEEKTINEAVPYSFSFLELFLEAASTRRIPKYSSTRALGPISVTQDREEQLRRLHQQTLYGVSHDLSVTCTNVEKHQTQAASRARSYGWDRQRSVWIHVVYSHRLGTICSEGQRPKKSRRSEEEWYLRYPAIGVEQAHERDFILIF